MSIIYRCDVCKEVCERDKTLRLVAYPKDKMATKKGDRSFKSVDICLKCFNDVFRGLK